MALGFLSVKGPEGISTAVKVPYHALFFRFLVGVTASARGNVVVGHCSFMYTSDHRNLLGRGGYPHRYIPELVDGSSCIWGSA
jgi:hypothetical protein